MEVWNYETQTLQRVPVETTHIEDRLPPLPEHEYCTPTARNIFQGDDPHELPFIPFADDPAFDRAKYSEEYKAVSWLNSVDPDLELVVIETARRLHTDHRMRYRHIDETGVLPLELLDRNATRGVLYRSRRRDFPDWPAGVPDSAKRLHDDTPAIVDTPDMKLAMLVSEFCTNLNCLVGFCTTHLDTMPMPLSVSPLVESDRMKALATTPCGPRCFLLESATQVSQYRFSRNAIQRPQPIRWGDDDIQFLRTFLDLAPDTIPCDLATLCAKPCFETFHQRKLILPDAAIENRKPKMKGKARPKPTKAASLKFDGEGKPCRHEGPCDAAAQCACFLNKAHCESGCRCSQKCPRRWRGCKCTAQRRRCRTNICACYLAHRECDPELCLSCQANTDNFCRTCVDPDANICRNAAIQRMKWKRTKVAPARWGRGLFMAEDVDVDDLIIEYVGELIYEPTTDSRECVVHLNNICRRPIAVHRGRNYLFSLNDTMSVDGTYAANDARYINHDAQNPNCVAKVWMVNGEHRIGIHATRKIKSGGEVLFDYGSHFFQGLGAQSGKESGSPARLTGS
ncbi:hypothetical protein B0H11DRAFT_1703540 [Mycena galericulata]|nr:hypothetical protein B0H11DRAFT_1703540 [Mycena galericulata]